MLAVGTGNTQTLMEAEELEFLEDMLQANELLHCATCNAETLHAHLEVMHGYRGPRVAILMQCTQCQATQVWLSDVGDYAK